MNLTHETYSHVVTSNESHFHPTFDPTLESLECRLCLSAPAVTLSAHQLHVQHLAHLHHLTAVASANLTPHQAHLRHLRQLAQGTHNLTAHQRHLRHVRHLAVLASTGAAGSTTGVIGTIGNTTTGTGLGTDIPIGTLSPIGSMFDTGSAIGDIIPVGSTFNVGSPIGTLPSTSIAAISPIGAASGISANVPIGASIFPTDDTIVVAPLVGPTVIPSPFASNTFGASTFDLNLMM